VQALLRCGQQEAIRVVNGGRTLPQDVDLAALFRARVAGDPPLAKPTELEFPPELRRLGTSSLARPFWDYLAARGYSRPQAEQLVVTYDLHYATHGRFAYRVVIPVYDRFRRVLTWTGRTILPDEELRYLTLSAKLALCATKDTLLSLPLLWSCNNPRALLICEGPFDAMWITMLGRTFGVYGTCLFGLTLSPPQMLELEALRARFRYRALLLDSAAGHQAFKLAHSGLELGLIRLPAEVKDPATLNPQDVINLCLGII
jgi:hypothetical protein